MVCLAMSLPSCQQTQPPEVTSTSEPEQQVHGPEHSDHNPRHGGKFFMALDMEHHLDLVGPGTSIVRANGPGEHCREAGEYRWWQLER